MTTAPYISQEPPESPRPLPRAFGRYKLFDFVGKGGMAEIYLARAETGLGAARLCVVKQIIPQFADHPEFAEMLTHEAKLAARLSHANIVQVFDLGREQGHLFIAMEYVEGMDLNALLRRCSQTKTALPIGFALRILSDTLTGLDYAHRAKDDSGRALGIVHRDVSPSNVLISLEGEVKICDFGIAHANDLVEMRAPQIDEAIKGKAGYMSPEHARGQPIDARADVFAAGILLWELLAGRRLYKTETGRPQLLEQARRAEIPDLPEKGLPKENELKAIVKKALAANRDERYATAGAMQRDLETYIASAKLPASPLKLGEWLVDRFGTATITQRRAREQMVSEHPPPLDEDAAPDSMSTPPVTPSLRALQEALLTEARATPVPPPPRSFAPTSVPSVSSMPPIPPSGTPLAKPPPLPSYGALPAAPLAPHLAPVELPLPPVSRSSMPPAAPSRPGIPIPTASSILMTSAPATGASSGIPNAPISVALGTVDLGPPSSAMVGGHRSSRAKHILLGFALVAIVVAALVGAWFRMPR